MLNIEKIEDEIVERLLPLRPEKIILFGSYAAGTATDDSDIDLFLVKKGASDKEYNLAAREKIRDLIFKYHIGFDILSGSQAFLDSRNDYFYTTEIKKNGKLLYAE